MEVIKYIFGLFVLSMELLVSTPVLYIALMTVPYYLLRDVIIPLMIIPYYYYYYDGNNIENLIIYIQIYSLMPYIYKVVEDMINGIVNKRDMIFIILTVVAYVMMYICRSMIFMMIGIYSIYFMIVVSYISKMMVSATVPIRYMERMVLYMFLTIVGYKFFK